jgi:predicted ArsR family transcriptional regulator
MASKKFADRIEHAAKFLATPAAQKARGYLDQPLETALLVLACFADGKPHDYAEVAEETGLHHNTVRQVVNALDRGGYPLRFTNAMVRSSAGRPTTTIQQRRVAKSSSPN